MNSPMSSNSILYKWWFTASLSTVVFFVVYQILIIIDQKYSTNPLCPYEDKHYGAWYWSVNYSVCGAFGITWIMLMLKIFQSNKDKQKIPYVTTFCLVSLGFLATIMALVWNWGGICVDVFGVASPAAIWGEWMSCGPLLLFITITIVDRPSFTRHDIIVMVSFFVSIAAGFIIIIKQPIWLASIWLAISVLAYLPMFWLGVIAQNNQQISTGIGADEFELFSELSAKRNNLCITLIYILPAFTVIYFLALAKVIDEPVTITCYQILSVLTKGLFAAVAMDAHLELLNPATRALIEEKRANEARRAFLRFIFHEVRTPLNSLTMGIEILERSDKLDESEVESLLMMRDASSFMTETLNDVLSMQKIEEGKLELELSPFSIRDALSKVCFTLKGSATAKGITIQRLISPLVPDKIIGDRFRIEHVLANILSNAIKFSPDNGKIVTTVTSKLISTNPDVVELTVSVTDQGMGVSPENQKKLFTTFMQIKPGQMQQGQGSGVGLSLCKQIVNLHGGTITCQSAVGEGSTFSFMIPFHLRSTLDDIITESDTLIPEAGTSPRVDHSIMSGSSRKTVPSPISKNDSNEKLHLSVSANRSFSAGTLPTVNEFVSICFETSNRIVAVKRRSGDFNKVAADVVVLSTEDDVIELESSPQKHYKDSEGGGGLSRKKSLKFSASPALVVDDVRSNRKMLTILLNKSGVISDMAEDGQEAVDMIRKDLYYYHMIFMDNMMPHMNGVQAAEILRKIGYLGLIIGITGNVLDDDVAHYLEGGADMVLSKPLKMSELDMILRHVEEHGSQTVPEMKLVECFGKLSWVTKT